LNQTVPTFVFLDLYMEETTMKIRTIVLATAFALACTANASATTTHKHHRHYVGKMHHGMTIGMAPSGPSGPGLEPGRRDESRVGGKGVSNRPGD
jgi:hypothetical protein